MEQTLPPEEPGWLPRWISATPFRHPIFLVVLAIPPLAEALHAWLLIPFLVVQLWWFQVGEASMSPHRFSPTMPAFLAGPMIGLALGLLHVREARQSSLLGFLTLTVALSWFLIPLSLELQAVGVAATIGSRLFPCLVRQQMV